MRAERVFFIHIMKTGGSSLRRLLWNGLEPDQIYPATDGRALAEQRVANFDPRPLLALTPAEHAPIRLYAAHLPYFAQEVMPRPLTMLTVLREPVARTVSFLRHCQRYNPQHRDLSLDAIYDDAMNTAMFVTNHQTKVFAVERGDQGASVAAGLAIDDARFALAVERLRTVELVGVQEDYEAFVARVAHRFGWPDQEIPRARVAPEGEPVPAALRRRIEADVGADLEFYEIGRELASA